MSTQKQLSNIAHSERLYKQEMALSLICWIFTSPLTTWAGKLFKGVEVPTDGISTMDSNPEIFLRIVVNEDGYDAGMSAVGQDLCCFSFSGDLLPNTGLRDEETLSRLTGEVIHGILLSLPEYIDLPETLAYQVRDEVRAFNERCGDGIFHAWCTSTELWKYEIFPRTMIMMQQPSALH